MQPSAVPQEIAVAPDVRAAVPDGRTDAHPARSAHRNAPYR